MIYKIADTVFDLTALHPRGERFLSAYRSGETPQTRIVIDEADVRAEAARVEGRVTAVYAESLAILRKLSDFLLSRDTLLFHGSAVAVDGEVYIFTAPSGTGKSTHARLWRELLGSRAVMVNDDKPFIRVGKPCVVFGSPWDGKHHLSSNTALPLKAICFLERAAKNQIEPIPAQAGLAGLLNQSYREEAADRILPLALRLSEAAALYRLRCNVSPDAAALSWRTLSRAKTNSGAADETGSEA